MNTNMQGLNQGAFLTPPLSGASVGDLISVLPSPAEQLPGCLFAPSLRPGLAGGGRGRARNWLRLGAVAAALGASLAWAQAAGLEKRNAASASPGEDQDAEQPAEKDATRQHRAKAKALAKEEEKEVKTVAWLGIGVEEASEALAAQLDLKDGEGLVVTFVASESPAAKAGFQKNDVLTRLDDQLLVNSSQFRKLIRRHKEGDKIKLTLYRNGKKEEISATLGHTKAHAGLLLNDHAVVMDFHNLDSQLRTQIDEGVRQQMKELHESLAKAGVDRQKLSAEIRRSLEQARSAMRDAMRNIPDHDQALHKALREIEGLSRSGVEVGKDATVIINNDRKSVRTAVKSDDSGTCVIVAGAKKHLTAHDKDGKLLFDGEIDTAEQQGKVPKEVWEKAKPLLEKLEKGKPEHSDAEDDSDHKPSL